MKAGYFKLLAGMAKGVLACGLMLNHCIDLIAYTYRHSDH